MMQILSGPEIDLISPFPANQIHRIYGWTQCFRDLQITDDSPQTKEEFDVLVKNYIDHMTTFGVVDRDNRLGLKHPIPLVGFIAFEHVGTPNKYIHFTSTRVAHGTGIMDQALQISLKNIFNTSGILRVSSMIIDQNRPARAFLLRNGFKQEGLLRSMVRQNGQPRGILHFGVFKDMWEYNPRSIHVEQRN